MFEMGTITATTTSSGVTMVTEMIKVGPYVLRQNWEVAPRDSRGSMARVEDILQKMMRRFDASDEHAKS